MIDAVFSESYMRDPSELLHRIKMCVAVFRGYAFLTADKIATCFIRLTGVLEVGLFTGMAEAAYFGAPDGTVTCRWQDGEARIAGAHFLLSKD
mgnify:CR=1 FL=1